MAKADPAPTPEPEATESDETIKPFGAWLHEQRNGALHAELGEKLAEIVARSIELEKAGSLTLTVKVNPTGDGQPSVFITDEVKAKPPEPPRPKALFFADDRGNLSRRDPRQAELPLKDVSKPPSPPREV